MTKLSKFLSLFLLITLSVVMSFCSQKDEVPQTRIIALSGDLNFGTVDVGKTATKTLTINNTGTAPLTVSNLTLPSGYSAAFSGNIAAKGSQDVVITFTPTASGAFNGIITVNSNQTSGTNTINITGTGFQVVKSINVTGDLNFGTLTVGESSQKMLSIINTGNTDLVVSGITFPTGFSGAFSGTIAPNATQPVVVTFKPTQAIAFSGTITVSANHNSGINTLAISGNGTLAPTKVIALLPSQLEFGSLEINKTLQKTFTIKNTGNATLTINSLTIPTGYTANYIGGTILTNASVDVVVTFAPTTVGSFNGTITINSNADSGMTSVTLTGTSVATPTKIIALSGNLAFGNVEVGKNATKTLTIANIGNTDLTVSSLTLPTGFTATFSGTIAANTGTQLVTITFAPTSAVVYSGNVTVNADQTSGTNTMAISGTGIAATVADPLAVYKKIYGATSITEEGNFVVIKSTGMPEHKSPYYLGTQWAATLYEAYNGTNSAWSQNPNKIASFSLTFKIPKNPTVAATHAATPLGAMGVAINGVPLYNQYAGPNNQALTSEINSFDQYNGHPQQQGAYHYHVEPLWLTRLKGKDALIGFMLDGFPVYGTLENGVTVTNSNLDVYHGHTHATADYPNGIYHYHITAEAPYINGNGFYGTAGTVTQ